MNQPFRSFPAVAVVLAIYTATPFAMFAAERNPLAGQRTLLLGDSITQDGRYVTFLEYYLHRLAPGEKYDLISIGLSSETVSGLTEPGQRHPRPNALDRLGAALTAVKPQLVLACYGMNDGIYHPPSPERLAAFAAGIDRLTGQVRASGAAVILITPPVFDPLPIPQRISKPDTTVFGYQATYGGYDDVLADFARVGRDRQGEDLTVIDLHSAMRTALLERRRTDPAFTFSPDGVHPGDLGHLLMARTVARGLGLVPPDNSLEAELARIQADPLFPLVRDRRALRSEAWLSFVGYTHTARIKSASVRAAEVVVARLQAEIEAMVNATPRRN